MQRIARALHTAIEVQPIGLAVLQEVIRLLTGKVLPRETSGIVEDKQILEIAELLEITEEGSLIIATTVAESPITEAAVQIVEEAFPTTVEIWAEEAQIRSGAAIYPRVQGVGTADLAEGRMALIVAAHDQAAAAECQA